MSDRAETGFAQAAREFWAGVPPPRLGVAVSGGGDSLALLLLADDWRRDTGTVLEVATVDHGLRPEAAAEAETVAAAAARMGLSHETLLWERRDTSGNLPDQARRARRALLRAWAERRDLDAVLLGHTIDDQAETLLMRLARGSGVDGLAAMSAGRPGQDLFLRPLLGVSRADLRSYLVARGTDWVEDPTNDDPRYDRVKARRALAELADLGIYADGLARTAAHMTRAREALERRADEAAGNILQEHLGEVRVDPEGLAALDLETRLRLLARVLVWVGNTRYRPRLSALEDLCDKILAGTNGVLAGCIAQCRPGTVHIHREFAAARGKRAHPGGVWDGRWRMSGWPQEDAQERAELRALGPEGLREIANWRDSGLPYESAMTLPGLWGDGGLIAAPHLGFGPAGCTMQWAGRHGDFSRAVLSH